MAMENKARGLHHRASKCSLGPICAIWDLINESKDATEAQAHVKQQRNILARYPPFPPTLKALLHRVFGFPRWSVQPPLVEITPETEERLLSEFDRINSANVLGKIGTK